MHQLFHHLNERFQRIIEPPESITDFGQRQVFRLVQSIVIVFVPIAIVAGGLPLFFTSPDQAAIRATLFSRVILPVVVLMLLALIGRYLGYRGTSAIIFLIGYSIVAVIVISEVPDYFDTTYLIIMTILASMMFGIREVAIVTVAHLIIIFAIVLTSHPENSGKLLSFQIVVNMVILFTSYYRNLLETDRSRQLAESEAILRLITCFCLDD